LQYSIHAGIEFWKGSKVILNSEKGLFRSDFVKKIETTDELSFLQLVEHPFGLRQIRKFRSLSPSGTEKLDMLEVFLDFRNQ
jgi:hypothetical protein